MPKWMIRGITLICTITGAAVILGFIFPRWGALTWRYVQDCATLMFG